MADVFTAFGNYAAFSTLGKWIMYIVLGVVIAAILVVAFIALMVHLRKKIVVEFGMVTRRFEQYSAGLRKNQSGRRQLYINKLGKFMPQIQQEDIFLKGKKDVVVLLKDNNGLSHTLRIPSYPELKKWYSVVHDVNLDDIAKLKRENANPRQQQMLDLVGTVYLLPNPAEDREWMAQEHTVADKIFKGQWWQSPVVMVIATVFLCVMMVIITTIIVKKM